MIRSDKGQTNSPMFIGSIYGLYCLAIRAIQAIMDVEGGFVAASQLPGVA